MSALSDWTCGLLLDGFAATCGRHALFPPRGEEKKSKVEQERHAAASLPAARIEWTVDAA
jgi:hypothetical protein